MFEESLDSIDELEDWWEQDLDSAMPTTGGGKMGGLGFGSQMRDESPPRSNRVRKISMHNVQKPGDIFEDSDELGPMVRYMLHKASKT